MSKWIAFFLGMVLSIQLYAKDIEVIGTIPVNISSEETQGFSLKHEEPHIVQLQKIRLSLEAKSILRERLEELQTEPDKVRFLNTAAAPERIDLGMNSTPVLDQGVHGTCVTFALTGALDAVIDKGDYISQLCSLSLGAYLQRRNQIQYSGWDGAFGEDVFSQLEKYGIVTQNYQKKNGCAGVKQYPLNNENYTGKPMTINEYSSNAVPLARFASWDSLVSMDQAFTRNHNPTALLRAVKKNLREGKRVTFGVLLDDEQGHAGAMGTYKKRFDSWLITPEIAKRAKREGLSAGHEMIIIGYDDQAVIRTSKGQTSKGVFILRNSWGPDAGDKGNFYMSYEYFKTFSDEAQVIVPVSRVRHRTE